MAKAWAGWEERTSKQMIDIYHDVCKEGEFFKTYKGKASTFISNKMRDKEDWWMSAEEAVYHGFVDDIIGGSTYPTIEALKDSV